MPEEKLDIGLLTKLASKPTDANPIMEVGTSKFDPGSGFSIDPTPEYYSKNLDYLNEARAQNQSTANRWGLAGLRVANKVAVEIASMPGYLVGVVEGAVTDKSIGEALDNHYLNSIKEYENTVNEELLKVYVPDAVKNGGLAANLGSASFWATEGADGVGFLTSMLIPGQLLKLAKLGTVAAETANAALKGYKWLKPASTVAKFGTRAAENFDNFTAALVNSTVESAAEAKEAFDGSMSEMTRAYMKANELSDPSQIPQDVITNFRKRAGEASSSVFKWNSALLIAPNLMDQMNLFGAFNSKKGLFASMFDDVGKVGTYTARETKDKLLNYALSVGKGFAKEGLFEEGSQFALSEYFKKEAANNSKDKRVHQDFIGIVKSYIDNLDNVDMQKSIALGGILGGPMSFYGAYQEEQYASKYGKSINEQLQNGLIDMYKGVLDAVERDADNNMVFETDEITGQQVPKLNPEKAKELFQQTDNSLLLNNLADVAMLEGNKEDSDLYRSVIHYNYFRLFFEQGKEGLDILKRHIQGQLANKEMDKQVLDEIFQITGSKTETEVVTDLLKKADDYYRMYDDINNRHSFDMPTLYGGTKDQRKTFNEMMRNKKLEKAIFNQKANEIVNKITSKKNDLVAKLALDALTEEWEKTTEDIEINEGDKKQLEFLTDKENQYKFLVGQINNDTKPLYDKPSIQEAYDKWLKENNSKNSEDDIKNISDDEVVAKFSKDLTDAGYVMDTTHILDPEKKAKMTPEELQAFIGNDRMFTFELNGKEYEAYSDKNPDGTTYRVYRDAATKQVVGKFDIEFLKKNKNIKIISKQEVSDRKRLAKLKANKEAKLKAFTAIYNSLNQKLADNEDNFAKLENQRRIIAEEVAVYQEWIKSISNESGYRAVNGKALEKQQVKQELDSLQKMLDALDSQIAELNNIYNQLQDQLGMLEQIQQDVNIVKEDNLFKSESDNIVFTDSQKALKQQIAEEFENAVREEQQLADILSTTTQAVAKAEQDLTNASDLQTEIQIIYEDLTRVKDINEIVQALLTADPNDLNYILAKYKPLKIVVANLAKLRDNTITDEEYLKVISVANNLLSDKYLGYGPEGLAVIKEDIFRATSNANKLPISNEAQYYIDANYFMPTAMAEKFVLSKASLLASANRMLEQAIGKQYSAQESAENRINQLNLKEGNLTNLLNDLFIQYRKALNRGAAMTGKATFNNMSPDEQAPEVYEDDDGTINPASYLSNYIFRNIGQDLDYDPKTGQTEDGGNGLPKLNLSDQNYRRLAQFIANNPKIAEIYNVRFFIGRTDDEGKKSVDIGGKSNDELLGLYETFESSPGSLDIGFYFVDKDGKVASENYNGETKTVIGWIPKGVADANGNLRINNAAAVRIVTAANGIFYDFKTNNKVINEYNFTTDNNVYTFQATNYGKESNFTVEIVDGKAVINTRFDNLLPDTSKVELSDERATLIAELLKENTKYSLSKAGKEIQSALKDSKTKYRTNINLTRTKTKLIENQGIIDTYGEITVEELIEKAKEELIGTPTTEGLYTTMVINPIVEQIETNKKPALTRIQTITRGVPIKQYNTNPDGTRNFQEPISHKITDVFSVGLRKGELDGGTLDIVNFTNQDTLGSSLGKVVLKTDNGETVPLEQRNLNSNEILTALYIMSFGDNMAQEAPEFGVTKDGKEYRMDTGDGKLHSRYRFFPFNATSTGSAITSLLYWGKHTDAVYTNAEGVEIPISTKRVGEIFAHKGSIYFKKKVAPGTWIDSSVTIDALKEALKSENPLQDPTIRELIDFLSDKKVNVNKQLLLTKEDKMKSSLYFHPKVTKTAEGYEFGYDTYSSYAEFLIKDVLTTTVNNEENFPKFANRHVVFRSKNQLKPDISDKFVQPEKITKPAPMKRKKSAASAASADKVKKTAAKKTTEDAGDTGDIDTEAAVKKMESLIGDLKTIFRASEGGTEKVIADEIENEPAAKPAKSILKDKSTVKLRSPKNKETSKYSALGKKIENIC